MASSIAIRRANTSDVEALAGLISQLAAHHGDEATINPERFRADLFGPSPWGMVLIAERAGGMVGYAFLIRLYRAQLSQRVLDLHHLFVVPDARGERIGASLVEAAIAEAKNQGCRQVSVGTDPSNEKAHAFYRKLGFIQTSASAGPKFKFKIAN